MEVLFLLVNKGGGITNNVVKLAVTASLKEEVEQVTAVTVVPVASLECSWSIQTPNQEKEGAWETGSDTRRSKLEKDQGKVWR